MYRSIALLPLYFISNVHTQLCIPGQYNSEAVINIITNDHSAIALGIHDTIIKAIGNLNEGADVPSQLIDTKIILKSSTKKAYACVTDQNETIAWGDRHYGGGAIPVDVSGGVIKIQSNNQAFAVLKQNGKVVTWGDARFGGETPVNVQKAYIIDIASNSRGFVAIDNTGVTYVWGYPDCVASDIPRVALDAIEPQYKLNTALAWADVYCNVVTVQGSTSADASVLFDTMKVGVLKTVNTMHAFASLTVYNKIQTWGHPLYGGQNDNVHKQLDISDIVSTHGAFGAITKTGRVIAWGNASYGGVSPVVLQSVNNAKTMISNERAFAVFTEDGKVVSWGNRAYGGERYFQTTGVRSGVATSSAFAVLLSNNTVISWGNVAYGGENVWWLTDVSSIHSHRAVFIAIKKGGEIVTWGDVSTGARLVTTAQCVDCPAGTKMKEFRARSCEPCGFGWWSPKGSIECQPCPLGICNKIYLTIVLTSCISFVLILLILIHVSPSEENKDDIDSRETKYGEI